MQRVLFRVTDFAIQQQPHRERPHHQRGRAARSLRRRQHIMQPLMHRRREIFGFLRVIGMQRREPTSQVIRQQRIGGGFRPGHRHRRHIGAVAREFLPVRGDQHGGDVLAVAPHRAGAHAVDPHSTGPALGHDDALQIGIRRGALGFGENQRALIGDAQIPHASTQLIDPPSLQRGGGEGGADGTVCEDERGVYVRGNWHNMHRISMDHPSESPPACMAAPGNGLFPAGGPKEARDGGNVAE